MRQVGPLDVNRSLARNCITLSTLKVTCSPATFLAFNCRRKDPPLLQVHATPTLQRSCHISTLIQEEGRKECM